MDLTKFFNIITSFRFQDGSIIYQKLNDIFIESPIIGYGFGYSKFADFAFYEVLSIGGLIALIAYIIIFLYILGFCIYHILQSSKEALLLFFIWILLSFSSIGAPIITANRISIIIWIITSLLIFIIVENQKRKLK